MQHQSVRKRDYEFKGEQKSIWEGLEAGKEREKDNAQDVMLEYIKEYDLVL